MKAQDNHSSQNCHAQTAELNDRRKWSRIPDAAGSQVRFSTPASDNRLGDLVEVAVGGFAIRVTDDRDLFPGQPVSVCFNEGTIRAVVKYVHPDTNDAHRVGMEWVQPKSAAVIAVLRRCLES
ncbi:MAG TPA: hypothetical protein VJL29_00675 [Thermoguttaceae bacterium]|nr:hypothetical protein [Thermoguttaceae bacterium]